MDLSGHESEIPIPISSSYVGVHGHGHPIIPDSPPPPPPPHSLHHSSSNGPHAPPPAAPTEEQQHNHNMVVVPYSQAKKGVVVRYRECLKNHAASIGGSATDGCGEFMPSGEEGSLEALKCSACSCHRNFHRKEVEGESSSSCDCYHHLKNSSRKAAAAAQAHTRGLLVSAAGPEAFGYPPRGGASLQHHHQLHQMVMPLGALQVSDQSDEMEGTGGGGVRPPLVKKRFRTKFTPEQKEKMLGFAERVGWRLQRQEESVVQQFCQEIGVKRRVLKVWMHNNKHNLAKKSPSPLQLE